MSLRLLSFIGLLICIGAGVMVFFTVPLGTAEILDQAHAAVNALSTEPGDPDSYGDRLKVREFDLASRVRQAEGAKAYNRSPSGEMTRLVELPPGTPDGASVAKQICDYMEKNGFEPEIEAKFPLVTQTDSHDFKLQPVVTQGASGAGNAVSFSFAYTGFIRQGEPRKIADYAESLVRREVNARCWSAAGFVANPPHVPDVSPTAVVTDLPDEPDTAAAQARLFHGTKPAALTAPPPMAAADTPSPAPVAPVTPAPPTATAYVPPPVSSGPVKAAGSDLVIKKPLKDSAGSYYINGLQYSTLDEVKPPDADKLLNQGQTGGASANGGPLNQPADQRLKVQQDQEHPQ